MHQPCGRVNCGPKMGNGSEGRASRLRQKPPAHGRCDAGGGRKSQRQAAQNCAPREKRRPAPRARRPTSRRRRRFPPSPAPGVLPACASKSGCARRRRRRSRRAAAPADAAATRATAAAVSADSVAAPSATEKSGSADIGEGKGVAVERLRAGLAEERIVEHARDEVLVRRAVAPPRRRRGRAARRCARA